MERLELTAGLLLSQSGSYAAVGNAMCAGAVLAIDEINHDPESEVRIKSVPADPAGQLVGYVEGARSIL
ncbi:hypothetical protein [Roseovarius sp. Pro17]|uniref:hypothetical protein n=1 Tax=Roseovarius sp. Pro17 TaxID=3108175 RepID=UPI002D7765B0|nr:hypothetical protein [Roseovarius sp. Pro17]